MLFKTLMLVSLISQSHAAGVIDGGGTGNLRNYLTCAGEDHAGDSVELVVRATAVPTFTQGYLRWTNAPQTEPIVFSCRRANTPIAEDAPSAGTILWSCSEIRKEEKNEGAASVRIFSAGTTSFIHADITRAPAAPSMTPDHVASLICKR